MNDYACPTAKIIERSTPASLRPSRSLLVAPTPRPRNIHTQCFLPSGIFGSGRTVPEYGVRRIMGLKKKKNKRKRLSVRAISAAALSRLNNPGAPLIHLIPDFCFTQTTILVPGPVAPLLSPKPRCDRLRLIGVCRQSGPLPVPPGMIV